MAKIAVSIPDFTLKRIDDLSNTKGITRSKYVSLALDFYAEGANNYKTEIDRLNKELAEKTNELESLSIEILPLREKVQTLSNTLTDKDREIGTKANEVFQKDKRLHTLENTLAEKDKKIESLSKEELLQKDEGTKIREELEKSKTDVTKYEMALKSKEDETAFLRGHVAQLTQSISQFALRPGDEEIKAKHWYQFWK
jgi:chromosome segregation ATPase